MVGLGTIFIAGARRSRRSAALARHALDEPRHALGPDARDAVPVYREPGRLDRRPRSGRQPWLVYGLQRTADGISTNVSAGMTWFTLLGFMGLYLLVGLLYVVLFLRIVVGPGPARASRRRRHGMINVVWFVVLVVMLGGYAVLDGFDLGVGALHLLAAARRERARDSPSTRSARSGTATRCGCSPPADRWSSRFRSSTRELQRLLPRADARALAARLPRPGHRVPAPDRPSALASGVGRGVLAGERAAGRALRRGARQRAPRPAARPGRQVPGHVRADARIRSRSSAACSASRCSACTARRISR